MGGLESPSDLLLGLIQDIERRFHDACVRKKYDFADILLEVCYLDPISLELCHLSLAHLLNQKNVPADWMLYVLDARSSKIPLPTWLSKNLFTSAASSSMQAYYLE